MRRILVILMTLAFVMPMIPFTHVRAVETVETIGPTASDYTAYFANGTYMVKYIYCAARLGGPYDDSWDFAEVQAATADEWVATGPFNSTDWYYDVTGPPTLPASNCTITYVSMFARVSVDTFASSRTFTLQYATNESKANISAGTAIWHGDRYNSTKTATALHPGTSQWLFSWNITSNETWTADLLVNHTWVRLYSTDRGSTKLYVDYVGLYYQWYYGEEAPAEGEGVSMGDLTLDVTGMFGLIGFLGMIVLPAVAIWMWRRESGDRIRAFVLLLAAGTFCFFMFYASIMGA